MQSQDYQHILTNQQLFKNSKVILTKQQEINLINFFNFCKVEKAKLLFRASQNQFKTDKFHQKCDNIPDTLCILQTQFGKILGGYTPLCWGGKVDRIFVKDQSGRSFLFSLTNNDKFKLVDIGKAIWKQKECGPFFGGGGGNFIIRNKTNITKKSGINTIFSRFFINPSYYSNSKYPQESKNAYQKLSGNPIYSANFQVKQWQVWSLQLKSH